MNEIDVEIEEIEKKSFLQWGGVQTFGSHCNSSSSSSKILSTASISTSWNDFNRSLFASTFKSKYGFVFLPGKTSLRSSICKLSTDSSLYCNYYFNNKMI